MFPRESFSENRVPIGFRGKTRRKKAQSKHCGGRGGAVPGKSRVRGNKSAPQSVRDKGMVKLNNNGKKCTYECIGLSYVAIHASLRASERVGCAWQVRAISSEEAPYSIASTPSATISPAFEPMM